MGKIKKILERIKVRLNSWIKSLGLLLKGWLNKLNNLFLRLRQWLIKGLINLFERLKMQLNNWRESLRLRLKMWTYIRPDFGVDDWIALFVLVIGVLGYVDGPIPYNLEWDKFYVDIRSELIGIVC